MSFQVPVFYQIRYRDDVIALAQQKESRLINTVRDDPDELNGKAGYFDRMAAVEANEVTGTLQDINLSDVPLSRRRILIRDFDWYGALDRSDKRRIKQGKNLPQKYVNNAVRAMNRKKDDLIIAAATGNAFGVDKDDAATPIALPGTQIVGVDIGGAGSGLNKAKILAAKEIIDGSDVDEEEERFAVVTAKQVTNLLNITEATSSDFATVKALVEGKISHWLGFTWIRSQRLTNDAANADRQCLFYTGTAMGYAKGEEIDTDISPRLDKRGHPVQASVMFSSDATRIEDEKLTVVKCREV